MFCTSLSQQQAYQPVLHKLDCCYFSGFRVLKPYFKPTVTDFTVLLFHKPLITGNDSLLDGMECLQTVLSVHLAPLLFQAGGGASAAQLPRAGQDRTEQDRVAPAPTAQPQFPPAHLALPWLPQQPTNCGSTAQKYTRIRILFWEQAVLEEETKAFTSSLIPAQIIVQ